MSLEGRSTDEITALATLADSLASNPKTRGSFQRLLKQANPHISVPEIEIEDRVHEAVKPLHDKLAEQEAKEAQSAARDAANTLYETLRDDRVVASRNDFGELVKYASEKGFQTSESGLRMAGSHRKSEQEAAEPTPHTAAGALDLSNTEQNKDLMKNPNAWARNSAINALAELQKRRTAA